MNIKKYFEEHKNKKFLCIIGIVIAVLVIFQAGVFVGYHKAAYSYGWGERYYKTFGERGSREHEYRGMMDFRHIGRGLSNSHGTIGKIISIALPTIIVEDQDRIEKTVLLTNDTMLRSFRDEIRAADLKVGDSVVIIGNPNEQAEIEARLIRIMPSSPASAPIGTTTSQQ
jgi:hypothetical protein